MFHYHRCGCAEFTHWFECIFNFVKRLNNNQLFIPNDELGTPTGMPFVAIGNDSFGLSQFVLRPHPKRNLAIKLYFWHITKEMWNVNIDFAKTIIKACCVLHKFVRMKGGVRVEHECYKTVILLKYEPTFLVSKYVIIMLSFYSR